MYEKVFYQNYNVFNFDNIFLNFVIYSDFNIEVLLHSY